MQQLLFYFIENSIALYVAVGILSLCIGSFLNVVIFRTPKIMEQEWHQECQMLLHPEQPFIDSTKLTQPACFDLSKVPIPYPLVSKYTYHQLDHSSWQMWFLPESI